MKNHLLDEFNEKEAESEFQRVTSFLRYSTNILIADIDKVEEHYVREQKMYHDCYSGLYKHELECNMANNRVLKALKKVKGRTFVKRFLEVVEASEGIKGVLFFSKEPIGKKQAENEYGKLIRFIWVRQFSVGYSGDSYEGTVSVQIKENKFLCFNYSM
jgi:hypothetical protein